MSSTAAMHPTVAEVPKDLRMAGTLWPILLASALGLVPFTVFNTFLVPIAGEAGVSTATMGSLRGLGGLAALLVGTALAPLVDRVPRHWTVAGSLALLGTSSLLGSIGTPVGLAGFCLLTGAATAALNPALGAAAADRFSSDAAAGRAATLVTATQSMTAMLAAPLVAAPAVLWGWTGDLVAVFALTVLLAGLLLWQGSREAAPPAAGRQRLGYLASFRKLARIPGAAALVLVGLLRTAAFMGYLSYLAAFYHDRFALSAGAFAFVFTLSGASFFVGNLLAGRLLSTTGPRMTAEVVLLTGLGVALAAMASFYAAPLLPVALVLTVLLGVAHATVAASVVTLLVRRCTGARGAALSLNAAGQSLGVFAGAGLGGVGLGLAGYLGSALVFVGLTLAAVPAAWLVLGTRRRTDVEAPT